MGTRRKNSRDLIVATRSPEHLGQALERFRARANLTQASLATSAGLRQATISKVEKGVETTEIGTVYAICAALGLELVLRSRAAIEEFRPEDVF